MRHVADIRAAVGELAAVPAGHQHAAVAVHVDIRGATKREKGILVRIKGRAIGGRVVKEHRATAPVAGVHGMVVGLGPASVVIEHAAATGAAAVVLERRHDFAGKILVPRWITVLGALQDVVEAHVPAAAVVGVVASEDVQVWINAGIEDVAQTPAINLHVRAVGPDANNAAAAPAEHAAIGAHGFSKSKVTHGNVDPAINAHADAVGGVVRAAFVDIFGADAGD